MGGSETAGVERPAEKQFVPPSSAITVLPNHLPPPPRNLVAPLGGQGIAVRLITCGFCGVVLQLWPYLLEFAKLELIIQLLHLADGIPNQLFVAQFVEPGRTHKPAV